MVSSLEQINPDTLILASKFDSYNKSLFKKLQQNIIFPEAIYELLTSAEAKSIDRFTTENFKRYHIYLPNCEDASYPDNIYDHVSQLQEGDLLDQEKDQPGLSTPMDFSVTAGSSIDYAKSIEEEINEEDVNIADHSTTLVVSAESTCVTDSQQTPCAEAGEILYTAYLGKNSNNRKLFEFCN